ncbi:hypothetical protein [Campylobacter majalis]|uniref:hypothetical protein n=1 Tax=Campylobacter majalis TaxID=2790656 RepID=UPI003D68BEE3
MQLFYLLTQKSITRPILIASKLLNNQLNDKIYKEVNYKMKHISNQLRLKQKTIL